MILPSRRVRVLWPLLGSLILQALLTNTAAAEVRTQTYTYKRVGDLEIKADVHRTDDTTLRPVVVWIHGGALITGGRGGVDTWVRKTFLEAGYVIVSIDYRLAPEAKLPVILEDVEDAFRWIRERGPELFHIDASKMAVLGGSAGGYLTLAAGYRVKPRPTVLVAFWGYGDLIGAWYSQPSSHLRHQSSKMTEEQARQQVSGPPITNAADRKGNGGAFYQFCRQRGIWPQEVSGWDPHKEAEKYYPYMPVKNVTSQYPPTLLIHGTKDTDVPYEQSVLMAAQFRKFGVDHAFITIPGGEHGLTGGDPKEIDQAYERAFQFVHQRMAGSPAPAADEGTAPSGAVVVHTKDNVPATPQLDALPLKESVSEYGITWTFEKPARVGQFINGDWYVVGPVTVVKIDPRPRYGNEVADDELDSREKVPVDQRCRNGSMLNAPARMQAAWDSGIMNYYSAEPRAKLPIAMKPGDSLASSISLKKGEKVTYPYHPGTVRGEGDNSPVKTIAVLTCVAGPLPPDAFRPGYSGHDAKIYLARDLRRDLLPHFTQPAGAPDPVQFAERVQRPWCDAGFFSFDVPQNSMPNYAQAYAQCVADAILLACCDGTKPEDRERLIMDIIQIGIDHYGLIRNGHPGWPAHGGHGSGRKFPIVFAGAMLGDETMANINRSFPKAQFGEDEQTAYGDGWTGAKVVFTGHSGIDEATGIGRDYVRAGNPWGPYEHLSPDQWLPEEFRSEAYRRANTSTCFVAQALVLRTMKLEGTWNHDAFFDYVDRWMFEDDKPFRLEIAKHCRPPYDKDPYLDDSKDWFHEGYADQPWVKQLWTKYRPLCPAGTDGWKHKHDDSYYRNAVEKQRKE